MKILLIEDNKPLAERMKRQLSSTYIVDVVHKGAAGIEKLRQIEYDAVIMDLGLPDIAGKDVCRSIRAANKTIPILVVTGVDHIDSKVTLLNLGADDYITKPFHARELKARIVALTRRCESRADGNTLSCGDLVLDRDARTAYRAGVAIPLRRKEFDILEYLMKNKGRVLTRRMIITHAWDSSKGGWGSTVDVHIKHLRDKIDRPFETQLIKTAYGVGYRVDASDGI